MEDTIIETTLEHYVRHLPKSTKTLNDPRRLAESLKMSLAIYSGTPSSSQKDKQLLVPTISVPKKLAEMENSRVKIFNSLRDTVIEMCEQSATTLREPTEKNQRALQVKKSVLDGMFKRFQTQISGFQKELDQLEENAHPFPQKTATLNSASLVVQAIYSQKELTVIEQEKKTCEHSRMSATEISLHLKLTNLLFRPDHVQYVLEKTQGFLSPLANYTLMGSFGSLSSQGTVHKAKLVGGNDENVVALKVEHLTSRISRDIISEILFTSPKLLCHPNILSSQSCSIFQTSQYPKKYYLALAFQPIEDGSLECYTGERWPERYISCVIKQVLHALSYIHSMGSLFGYW